MACLHVKALRTRKNTVPHTSHRCSDLMSPPAARTWPTGAIRWLRQEGHRGWSVSGSASAGDGMEGLGYVGPIGSRPRP
jgi:hypothetical protein